MVWAARRCKANPGIPQRVTDVSKGCHIFDGYVAGVRSVGKTKISAKTRAVLRKAEAQAAVHKREAASVSKR